MGSRAEGGKVREIFTASEPRDPGRVFYTIRRGDVGKSVLNTEIGPIHVTEFIGRVLRCDVGKRLYRVPNNAGDMWFWQVESQVAYENRTGKAGK